MRYVLDTLVSEPLMNRREALVTLGSGAGGAFVAVSHGARGPDGGEVPPAAGPEVPASSLPPAPFSGEHVKRLRFVAQAGFVPDGEHGFYTMSEIDPKLREHHSLWLFDRHGQAKRRVAAELGDITGVAPSPDGRTLALVADANGKKQIHLVAVGGGKPRVLTSLPQGVGGAPVWAPDGRSIA
jgi:hypothetical protein